MATAASRWRRTASLRVLAVRPKSAETELKAYSPGDLMNAGVASTTVDGGMSQLRCGGWRRCGPGAARSRRLRGRRG